MRSKSNQKGALNEDRIDPNLSAAGPGTDRQVVIPVQNENSERKPTAPVRNRPLSPGKRFAFISVGLVISFVLTVGVLEVGARFYAYEIALKGRRFQSDPKIGYVLRPELEVRRRSTDGTVYTVATDALGRRVTPGYPDEPLWREDTGRRILVLGDSFAEGMLPIEDRMDRAMERLRPEWASSAVGVSGFGTDQELALAANYYNTMQPGDVVLLLTCGNDLYDLVRRSNSGRAKSFTTLEDGAIVEHPPSFGLASWLRDRSFLAGFAIVQLFPLKAPTREQMQEGSRIYAALVSREAERLKARGIHFMIAHHMDQYGQMEPFWEKFASETEVPLLALDPFIGRFGPDNPLFFPNDFHWNVMGNSEVARLLIDFVDDAG